MHFQEISFDFDKFTDSKLKENIESYASLVLKWSKIHNITGAKNLDSIYKEIRDSLIPSAFLRPFQNCIDVGSGAGFPAVLLSFLYKDSFFYLLEPRAKRFAFLQYVKSELKLQNIEVINNFSYNISNIKADLITSRAVCESKKLIKDSIHLLAQNGYFLLFKGEKSIHEYKHLTDLNIQIFKDKTHFFIYANSRI